MHTTNPQESPYARPATPPAKLPTVYLPSDYSDDTITTCAESVARILRDKEDVYLNAQGDLCELAFRGGKPYLDPVTEKNYPAFLASVAKFRTWKYSKDEGRKDCPANNITQSRVSPVYHARASREGLKQIIDFASYPLFSVEGGTLTVKTGYVPERKAYYAPYSSDIIEMPIDMAKETIFSLFRDYDFKEKSDESRAVAALFAPALCAMNIVKGPRPMFVIEANQSQTGKTKMVRAIAAVYNSVLGEVQSRDLSDSKLENDMSFVAMNGKKLILIDNAKGKIDSPFLETFLTGAAEQTCRASYTAHKEIQPRNHVIYFTSNGAKLSDDLANRSCFVRIKQRAADHKFQTFGEYGTRLEGYADGCKQTILSAIFTVLKYYVEKGCPCPNHYNQTDFAEFFNRTSAICEILGLPPTSDDLDEIKDRASSKIKNLLRDIATVAQAKSEFPFRYTGSNLLDWARAKDINLSLLSGGDAQDPHSSPHTVPTLKTGNSASTFGKYIGPLFKTAYTDSAYPAHICKVDGYIFVREIIKDRSGNENKYYTIFVEGKAPDLSARQLERKPESNPYEAPRLIA